MIRDERRETRDERKVFSVIFDAKKALFWLLLFAVAVFAAPQAKSANAYYGDAAYLYFQNRLPSAEIACDEGLAKYPNDTRLQNLKARIQEAKDEQEKQNEKNNPNGQNNKDNQENQDNQDQDKGQQNKDQQNQDQQGNSSSSEGSDNQQGQNGEGSSSSENSGDQQNQNGAGESSSSEGSSDSKGDNSENNQDNEQQPQGAEEQQEPEDPNAMSKAEASQLLKDFDEQNGERKPWKPARGQAYPEKDW